MVLKQQLFIFYILLFFCLSANAQDFDEIPLRVEFLQAGGYYDVPQQIKLHADQARIHYTLNGNIPSVESAKYDGAITIDKTTVIRAAAFRDDEKSAVVTQTFFINEPETNFPTISIAITPYLLFDEEKGLFQKGPKADTTIARYGANFWSRQEVQINTEFYESDGRQLYNSISGMRVFGGLSRVFPQKSLALISRKRYGTKRFKFPVFKNQKLKKYKYLVLRNSGSDFGKSHFRDAFMTGLLDHWDIEKQAYRPSHVYINGEYWGIYNIREKVNTYFIASHQNVHPDSIDLLEHKGYVKKGNGRHYYRMLDFMKEKDMRLPENYASIQTQMEVDNFMNYQIAQIFFGNTDAGGNIKFWRPQTEGGKWRWILYDTDVGFDLYDRKTYRNDALAFFTEEDGPYWPNPPWSTFVLRSLLENETFKQEFVNRFADHLNTTFDKQRMRAKFDAMLSDLAPEIGRHHQRWNLSSKQWERHLEVMRTFMEKRPVYMKQHLNKMFQTGKMHRLKVLVEGEGKVSLNNYIKIKDSFEGDYFQNIPVRLEASPKLGYQFSHWETAQGVVSDKAITLSLKNGPKTVKAVFERAEYALEDQIFINEISSNHKKSGDWLELYNASSEKVDLEGWVLKSKKKSFILPKQKLASKSYLVLCEDTLKFRKHFPEAGTVVGNFQFGINKVKESLELYTGDLELVDRVAYQMEATDTLFTLDLLAPNLDNSNLENWQRNYGQGSPNEPNPVYLASTVKNDQERWFIAGLLGSFLLVCFMVFFMRQNRPVI